MCFIHFLRYLKLWVGKVMGQVMAKSTFAQTIVEKYLEKGKEIR